MLQSKDHNIDIIKEWCQEDTISIKDMLEHKRWAKSMLSKYAFHPVKRILFRDYYNLLDDSLVTAKEIYGEDYDTTYNILSEEVKREFISKRRRTGDSNIFDAEVKF